MKNIFLILCFTTIFWACAAHKQNTSKMPATPEYSSEINSGESRDGSSYENAVIHS